jgi:hypothetical protein
MGYPQINTAANEIPTGGKIAVAKPGGMAKRRDKRPTIRYTKASNAMAKNVRNNLVLKVAFNMLTFIDCLETMFCLNYQLYADIR